MNDISGLEEQFKALQEINLKSLKRAELGPFDFGEISSHLEEMHSRFLFFSENKELLKSGISQEQVNKVQSHANEFIKLTEEIKNFDPTSIPNPKDVHKQISDRVAQRQNSMENDLLQLFTYVLAQSVRPEEVSKELDTQRKQIGRTVREIESKHKEADEALKKIKDISASTGFTVYSNVFETQAKIHDSAADRWFRGAFGAFIAVMIYILYLIFINKPIPEQPIGIIVQNAFVKVLFLSTLFYALYQCVRNYNTNKHLHVLNKHRQNAIETFDAFANAAPSPEVKSAILMQATKAIFDFNKSGYLTKDNPSGSSFNVIDFFHKLGSK